MNIVTYRFRIKDSSRKVRLKNLADAVNFVWNYINETSQLAWKRDRKRLSAFDLAHLTAGSSKHLGLHSDAISVVSWEFVARRNASNSSRLSWRTSKRKLGWVPFRGKAIRFDGDTFTFQKKKYRFWKTREINGKIKSGSFCQNSKGQWFVNLHCETNESQMSDRTNAIGIDLGLKTIATLSDGVKLENPRILSLHAVRLAMYQRANKRKQVTNIQIKIKNLRKDFLHKESSKIVNNYGKILVGDVSSLRLAKTRMAKSVYDAGWGLFKNMLEYKANRLGVNFSVVSEKYSSVTCSSCFKRSGPSGLSSLGVREWICNDCRVRHDRDVNAARNILLGPGRWTPIGESHSRGRQKPIKLVGDLSC